MQRIPYTMVAKYLLNIKKKNEKIQSEKKHGEKVQPGRPYFYIIIYYSDILHTYEYMNIIVSLFSFSLYFYFSFYIINFNHEKNFYKQLHKSNAEIK